MEFIDFFLARPILTIFVMVSIFILINISLRLWAKTKANIDIQLEKDLVEVAEQINGSVEIEALKELAINKIKTRLVIQAEIIDSQGQRNKKRLYDDSYQFSNPIRINSGARQSFSFSLSMPDGNSQPDLVKRIKSYVNSQYKLRCYLESRVYCAGANLKCKKVLRYIYKEDAS